MENPAVAADGFCYEWNEIERWLRTHDRSPMTNMALPHKFLNPNRSLKTQIQEYLAKHPELYSKGEVYISQEQQLRFRAELLDLVRKDDIKGLPLRLIKANVAAPYNTSYFDEDDIKNGEDEGRETGLTHPSPAQNDRLLHFAARCGAVKTVSYLLEQRASLAVQNVYAETPLHSVLRGTTDDDLALEMLHSMRRSMNRYPESHVPASTSSPLLTTLKDKRLPSAHTTDIWEDSSSSPKKQSIIQKEGDIDLEEDDASFSKINDISLKNHLGREEEQNGEGETKQDLASTADTISSAAGRKMASDMYPILAPPQRHQDAPSAPPLLVPAFSDYGNDSEGNEKDSTKDNVPLSPPSRNPFHQPFSDLYSSSSSKLVLSEVSPISVSAMLLNAKDNSGLTVLHLAAKSTFKHKRPQLSGMIKCLQFLLNEPTCDVHVQDANGCTALHLSVEAGNKHAVEMLLESNSDPSARNREGRTAFDVCKGVGGVDEEWFQEAVLRVRKARLEKSGGSDAATMILELKGQVEAIQRQMQRQQTQHDRTLNTAIQRIRCLEIGHADLYRDNQRLKTSIVIAQNTIRRAQPREQKRIQSAERRFQKALRASKDRDGKEKDPVAAYKGFKQAAADGHTRSMYHLAICYENGFGIRKDMSKAFKWYEMAALQGNFRAQTEVGYFYRHGIGVKRDDFMAVEWYTRAAEAGHSVAQYNLGLRFLDGKGLREPNREKAVYWLKRAALQKDKDACKKLLKMGIVIS